MLPRDSPIGWRVDLSLTDFNNSAFVVFVVLVYFCDCCFFPFSAE